MTSNLVVMPEFETEMIEFEALKFTCAEVMALERLSRLYGENVVPSLAMTFQRDGILRGYV